MRSRRFLTIVTLAAAVALLAPGCRLPTAPLPEGALPYAPNPDQVANWWRQVEECSGMRGDLRRINFYLVVGSSFMWEGQRVIGLWMERDSRIVLAGDYAFRGENVRHEMLHALTRLPGHPPEYFEQKCRGVVDPAWR